MHMFLSLHKQDPEDAAKACLFYKQLERSETFFFLTGLRGLW